MENNIKKLIQTLIKEEMDPRRPKDKAFDLAQQLSKLSPEDRKKVAMIQQMISKEKMELGYLKEITDYDFKGSEVISRVSGKQPDLFGKQLFSDILPMGVASEDDAIKALQAHDKSDIKQRMDRFAPMFVHIQYHEFEHEGEKYRLHQTQYSNSNFKDKDPNFNPKVTLLNLMKLDPDTKDSEDIGLMLVKTDEYVKDLEVLRNKGVLGKRVMEGDTYEKMAAKGKKAGNLKQGTVRKRLRIKDGEKIPLARINKAISSLKKRKSLNDKDKKYLKALNLAKTLKTTTNIKEIATELGYLNEYGEYKSQEEKFKQELDSMFKDYRPFISLGKYAGERPDSDPLKGKGFGSLDFVVPRELPPDEFKKALNWVKSKGFEVKSQSNEYEVEFDGDRAYYPKIKFHFDANKFDTE